MASRDLTTTFQERRAASNMRRRKAGNGGMKPFGTYIVLRKREAAGVDGEYILSAVS